MVLVCVSGKTVFIHRDRDMCVCVCARVCENLNLPGSLAPEVPLFQGSQASLPQPEVDHPSPMFFRQKEITGRWRRLLQCLQEERKRLAGTQAVLSLLQEVEAATDQLGELQVGSRSAELWEVVSQHWCP